MILKESRDKLDAAGFLGHGGSGKIAGYRGGYTPLERREIERKMTDGELSGSSPRMRLSWGLISESWIPTVIVGYPGTRAFVLAADRACGQERREVCELSDP